MWGVRPFECPGTEYYFLFLQSSHVYSWISGMVEFRLYIYPIPGVKAPHEVTDSTGSGTWFHALTTNKACGESLGVHREVHLKWPGLFILYVRIGLDLPSFFVSAEKVKLEDLSWTSNYLLIIWPGILQVSDVFFQALKGWGKMREMSKMPSHIIGQVSIACRSVISLILGKMTPLSYNDNNDDNSCYVLSTCTCI